MTARIDFEKSLRRKRLIYKGTFGQLLITYFNDYANSIFTLAFFYVMPCAMLYDRHPDWAIGLLLLITAYIGVNVYYINKLYIVSGISKRSNTSFLKASLLAHYNKIDINDSGSQVLTGRTRGTFWAFHRTFTALFDEEFVALNLSVFGKGDMMYCTIALFNYYKCKALLKNLP